MRLNAYTIYDSAAKAHQRPFFVGQDGEAMRAFQDLVNDEKHPVGMHPEHYSLFRIGTFDDNLGAMSDETNECLGTALALKNPTVNVPEE